MVLAKKADERGVIPMANYNDASRNLSSARAVLDWTQRYGFQTVLAVALTVLFMYSYLRTMAHIEDAVRLLAVAHTQSITLQERQLEQTQALRADVQALQRAVVYGMPLKP